VNTTAGCKGVDRLLKRLPAFSPIAIRLLSVLADERISFKEVARLIALDPVLSGQVLRLANSGLYGRGAEVRSILTATAMLGLGKLSQVVMTAALWRGLPRRTSPFVRDWWRHGVAAALIAQQSDDDLGSDFGYTAALLHGVGQLALFEEDPRGYQGLVENAYVNGFDLCAEEREIFGIDHASLAGLFLETWGVPETLCEAVKTHHFEGSGTPIEYAVQMGCAGAEHVGFGRCGCHDHLVAGGSGPVTELLARKFPLDALVVEVNRIECSLA
jgi:HD-like signal output (HDOD) protein